MGTSYDTIGVNYSDLRKPDLRIEKLIESALGSAESVLNVPESGAWEQRYARSLDCDLLDLGYRLVCSK